MRAASFASLSAFCLFECIYGTAYMYTLEHCIQICNTERKLCRARGVMSCHDFLF